MPRRRRAVPPRRPRRPPPLHPPPRTSTPPHGRRAQRRRRRSPPRPGPSRSASTEPAKRFPDRPLDQAAVTRRVRPRIEPAAAAQGSLGDPHLLERGPVLGGAFGGEQRHAVVALEREVH